MAVTSILALILMLHRAVTPKGQVLASINGAEITTQDVDAESRASGVPLLPTTRAALLDRVVGRKLLAASAQRQGLDHTPAAPSDLARVQQTWLAQQALRRVLVPRRAPDPATLAQVEASHPFSFARRASLTLDILTVSGPSSLADTLSSYTDLAAAAAFVRRLGLPADRRTTSSDTAQLVPQLAAQLASLPEGAVLLRVEPGRLTLSRVLARTPIVLPPSAESALAQQVWAEDDNGDRIRAEVNRLKAAGRIVYADPRLRPTP